MTAAAFDPAAHFAQTYAEARDRFLAAAATQQLAVASYALPDRKGAAGEALHMDAAWFGAADASGLLVLTSGTHGIEGFGGSGCQCALLLDPSFARAVRDAGVAVLFVHAVNPHGFSHQRRVNEDNVDLNRNFHDFTQPLPVNAAYAEIHSLLLPATWPPPAENTAQIGAYIAAHGEAAFQAAVSGGQYAFPDGMFYGGSQATWSNRTLRGILRRQGARRRRMCWIDVHTGLGPRGHGEMIHAGRGLDADLARARDCWGTAVTSFHDGSSASARVEGIVTGAACDECPGVEITAIGLEYGTVPLAQVFAALRGDHWLHNHPGAPQALRAATQSAMRTAFHDEAEDWKRTLYAQAHQAVLKAIAYLVRR